MSWKTSTIHYELSLTEEQEAWLTGFWEGDGYAKVLHPRDPRQAHLYPIVDFYQADRTILDYIASLLIAKKMGGYSTQNQSKCLGAMCSQKTCWDLRISGTIACKAILTVLSKHVVSALALKRLNEVLNELEMPAAEKHSPSLSWSVGFWDAEGSSSYYIPNNTLRIYLSQSDQQVLEEVQQLWQLGHVHHTQNSNYDLEVSCKQARTLVPLLSPYSHNEPKLAKLLYELEANETKLATGILEEVI